MSWWKSSVFYEIYVRSFQDSNDDGVGDLNGIRERLDYLSNLGVDAVWITPFYPSPQVDFGYDVSDYQNVDPLFGTLDDFERLVDDAHRRSIRVVIDLVLNHTSDQHPFFRSSRASKSSPYRDWYVWRDGRAGGQPPNNWESGFGGAAWTFDERTDQWYYHFFYREQPDLNWRNPAVERWILEVMRFWVDRGVDGFRLDAINTLFEDPALRDNPQLDRPRVKLTGVDTQEYLFNRGLPEVHDVLRRLRRAIDRERPGTLLVSEAYVDTVEELVRFYGPKDDEIQLPFNFFLAQVGRRDARAFRRAVEVVEQLSDGRWPSLVLSNHDIERACDRLADGADPDAVAKLLGTMLLTLRGTPFIYYGEELAMRTDPPAEAAEIRDPVGRRFWPDYKGRDGVRRPMPWTAGPGVGFTTSTPWLPPRIERGRDVESQTTDPASVLSFYRSLLQLRRQTEALRQGRWRGIGDHPHVFAYLRESLQTVALVVLNMDDAAVPFDCDDAVGVGWSVAVGTHRRAGDRVDRRLDLSPLEAIVAVRT